MRIFQILEFNQFNTGSVHQMFQAATGLRERGHELTVVSRPDAILQRRCEESDVAFCGLRMGNQFDIASARRLAGLVRQERPDVIHVHKGVAHALALAATWMHPVRAFVVNRGVSFPLDVWNRAKFRARRVHRIVAVCEQIRRVVIDSGKLSPDKVVVIYAGTDVSLFDPSKWDGRAFRREKNIADEKFLIAQVGVREWKGWKDLVDAAAALQRQHDNIHLALIGCRHDSEADEVKRYASDRGLGERVTAVEYRTDMANVLASCDVVVDASWAGTGITGTIREAMAMEKPVVATDCGGNGELVSSAEVGWLIPMRNPAALVSAIREVIEQRDRAADRARKARQHVVQGFSKERRIMNLEELYTAILEQQVNS